MIFILKILVYPLSLLPLAWIRFILSPLKFLLNRVIKYRSEVIIKNIRIAFPKAKYKEIKGIQEDFYNNLFQLVCESIKSFTMSEKEASRRMKVLNPEVLDKYAEVGRSAIMVFGHYNNWEWTPLSCPSQIKHHITAIYQKIKNEKINDWIMTNRSRFGVIMIATKDTQKFYENNTRIIANTFMSDQSPSKKGSGVWVDFFGRKTLFLAGAAVYAKNLNQPIVFIDIQRIKSGYYEITIEELVEKPNEFEVQEIVQKFATRLEAQIIAKPSAWLWSHNRWKHEFIETENTPL